MVDLGSGAKMCSIILAGLSLELLLVFAILKLDSRTSIADLDWIYIIIIPLSLFVFFLIVWMLIHFLTVGSSDREKLLSTHPQELLNDINVEPIENYNETSVFRDILLILSYLLFVALGAVIYTTPCFECNTPYSMLALGIVTTYSLRAIVAFIYLLSYFRELNLIAREVYLYQTERNEDRLLNYFIPDYKTFRPKWITFGLQFVGLFSFALTLTLALLGTVWIANRECSIRCARLVHYSEFLLFGMYVMEGLYVLTVVILRYYERTSGVELIRIILKRVSAIRMPHPQLKRLKQIKS